MIPLTAFKTSTLERHDLDTLEVSASVRLQTTMQVSRYAMQMAHSPIGLQTMAQAECVRSIWDKVYGDLREPLRELMFHAQKNATHDSARVAELCAKLNGLLSGPQE